MVDLESIFKIKNIEPDFHCKKTGNLSFSGVSIDSRTITKDELFVAIKGEHFDGHNFIQEIISKGVKASIIEYNKYSELLHLAGDIHFLKVKDTLKALQELGNINRKQFGKRVFAITGTNGKTTTKEMLFLILSRNSKVLKSYGNYNNEYGVPLTLLKINEEHDNIIIEMGASRQGEIAELCKIAEPDIGIITCVGKGHLEFFKSIENVARTKAELLEFVDGKGMSIVPAEDSNLRPQLSKLSHYTTFGLTEKADVKGKIINDSRDFTTIVNIDGKIDVKLKVPGRKNSLNALAAAAAGLAVNISYDDIKKGLEAYTSYKGRLEIKEINGFLIIDDTYNSNPESLSEALAIAGERKITGKKIAVLGDMLELGEHSEIEHKKIGELARINNIEYVFTFGNYSRLISEESKKQGIQNSMHFNEKSDIVNRLIDVIKHGDLLLVKGSRGMKMEDIVIKLEEYYSADK